MPFCLSCGREVGEEDRFCPSCGQVLPIEVAEEQVLEAERAVAPFERDGALVKHLGPGERVLWSGKPVKLAFLFSGSGAGFFGPIVMVPIVLAFFGLWAATFAMTGGAPYFVLFFVLIVILAAVGSPMWQLMRYRNTKYMITNQRLITQTGAVGLDTRFVDLDKVQEVYVKVGLMDKVFGTGSVIVVTAGFVPIASTRQGVLVRPSLEALREPYEVQRILQEAIG